MASSKYSKQAAEEMQPVFYGSTTRGIMDKWHLSKYAERPYEKQVEADEKKLSRGQRKRLNKRIKKLINKGKLTGRY